MNRFVDREVEYLEMKRKQGNWELIGIFSMAVALRAMVSMYSYSGANTPPMYGDYEAQRHWQEITVNIPVEDWYTNTTQNDLQYWGLDYPPLTAYHSYLMGKVAQRLNESFVELHTSRGIESDEHKTFMRFSVLIIDVFLYLPSMLFLALTVMKIYRAEFYRNSFVFVCLMFPGQILIDNGHFQYNNVSLAFAALAIAAILRNHDLLAAFLYTLAFNYKQMELYHSLAFFAYLMGKVLRNNGKTMNCNLNLKKLVSLGTIVIVTTGVIWSPWLFSVESAQQVINRLFPVGRGIFEDKVASFWCVLSVVFKLKDRFTNHTLALLCLGATIIATIPTVLKLISGATKRKFLYTLNATAMAFFLFSFQVHEKSILLVCLPAMCLFPFDPHKVLWFLEVATFSMFPLFHKDNLAIPFFISLFLFHVALRYMLPKEKSYGTVTLKSFQNFWETVLRIHHDDRLFTLLYEQFFYLIVLCLGHLFIPSPERYPYIWPLINALFSFFHFFLFFLNTSSTALTDS